MVTTLHVSRNVIYETAVVPPEADDDGSFVLFSKYRATMMSRFALQS